MSDLIIVLNKRIEELEAENRRLTDMLKKSEAEMLFWRHDSRDLRAENKRLRELVAGATEVVEISNFTFPAQREWKAAWLKKAAQALKEASHE